MRRLGRRCVGSMAGVEDAGLAVRAAAMSAAVFLGCRANLGVRGDREVRSRAEEPSSAAILPPDERRVSEPPGAGVMSPPSQGQGRTILWRAPTSSTMPRTQDVVARLPYRCVVGIDGRN
jgi:hypothetical protein